MTETSAVVRRLKIDMIADRHNPIIEWFNALWDQVQIMVIEPYTNTYNKVYYIENNGSVNWFLFYNEYTNTFLFNYNPYWLDIFSYHNLSLQELALVVNLLLLENKLDVYTNPTFEDTEYVRDNLDRLVKQHCEWEDPH